MDAIRPRRPHDGEFSPGSEDAIDNPDDSDAGAATFEAIEFAADDGMGRIENEADGYRQNPQRALTAAELNAQHEKIKRLADATLAAPQDRASDRAAAFFILAVENTHSSVTQLANALHDAFSTPLNVEKTAMLETFEIAVKKQMLAFINLAFITKAHRPQAAQIIDDYIGELAARRDGIRLGAANAEFLLASGLGEERYAAAVRDDIAALKQGTHYTQVDMSQALSIADNACSAVDMLDQFEMMLRNRGSEASTLNTELQHLSLLADRWEDFVQKYAQRTPKKC
ncbi:hypothetical protein [Brenneria tiliae]|uniref:hypothetical protein n=1 Tax=Brenneria tiliae TaxID=2914984 RepID=UPI002014D7ED|nr:hypothetical protein [Brenneria tiliae]MCL2896734.1 hypothetical protein [Brenneria tiliae]MCL2901283.1 hypothetical protein [Brenneria tiliae]